MFKKIDENSVNYEKDKNIDIHNLHEEFMRNPSLVGDYIKLRTQAEDEVETSKRKIEISKANFDRAKAKLELDIRKSPEKYDPAISKLTENIVSSLMLINIVIDEECVKFQKELTEA